jgi:hypothetical protein
MEVENITNKSYQEYIIIQSRASVLEYNSWWLKFGIKWNLLFFLFIAVYYGSNNFYLIKSCDIYLKNNYIHHYILSLI